MGALVIIETDTRKVVRRFDTTGMSERQVEKLERGMMRNLDSESYHIAEEQ